MTDSTQPRIPTLLWQHYRQQYPDDYEVVDLRLRNGQIRSDFLTNEQGLIVGRIVGGHDGIDPHAIDFNEDEIVAVRQSAGLVASLHLTPWITATDHRTL